jgi:subtilisin family serine protease
MGVKVLSTLPGGKFGRMSGTSMASPFTAGAIALLGAHFPSLGPYVIAEALVETAERRVRAPWDKQYGHGMINVNAAFLLLKTKFPH